MVELTAVQERALRGFRAFVDREIAPHANDFDRLGQIPFELLDGIGRQGYWGAGVPAEYGGTPMDATTFGLLCQELGRGSCSVLSIFTVHTILTHTLLRWGTEQQRAAYLPRLSTGAMKGAFALSEPEVGSDASSVRTRAVLSGDAYLLSGQKKWVSAGRIADVLLTFTTTEDGPTAFLVESEAKGVSKSPISASGFRAALMAELVLSDCAVPTSAVVGRVGAGFSLVTTTALDHGRYCIAWGAVGLAEACLDASASYARRRLQFGVPLGDQQLIRKKLADMYTELNAARLLCCRAGRLREQGATESILETSVAKYFSSRASVRAALEAVQIHGANGLSDDYPVGRYLRDSKVFEIIEGSNEMQQLVIGEHVQRTLTHER